MENYENIKVNFDSFIQSLESNPDDIEFRKKSFLSDLSSGIIVGLGVNGYSYAFMQALKYIRSN